MSASSGAFLTTDRLRLCPLEADHAPALFAYRGDEGVARYQGWAPRSVADAESFIAAQRDRMPDTPGTWFQLGVFAGGELVGDLGLHFPANTPRQVEFGISLAPAAQGRGYADEALRAATSYVFGTLGKHRLHCSVDPRNLPSMAMARRLGMRQEAHLVQSLYFKGEWVDDVIFGLLSTEWCVNTHRRHP